jgi:hypothetical protein
LWEHIGAFEFSARIGVSGNSVMLLQQQHLAWRHAVPYREHRMIIVRAQHLPTPRRQRVAQRQPRLRPEQFEAEPRLFGEFLGAVVVPRLGDTDAERL